VRSLPEPRLTYARYIQEVETRVGPQENKIGLSQTIPWFGKLRERGQAAWEAAEAERERYEAAKLSLFYRVKEAYYEYYYLGRAVAVVRETLALVKQLEQVARVRYKVAAGGHPDVIRAQVELGKLQDRLRTHEELRGPLVARLNAALNRPVQSPLPWPKGVPELSAEVSDEQLLRNLGEGSPELRALAHEVTRHERLIELARKDYYPDVTFGLEYIDTGGARMPGVADSSKDPVIAMISVNIPLWRARAASRAGLVLRHEGSWESSCWHLSTSSQASLESQVCSGFPEPRASSSTLRMAKALGPCFLSNLGPRRVCV